LFSLFNFDSIYTTQDPPVKSRFYFSISIGRSFSEIVARSSMNTQSAIWLDSGSSRHPEKIRSIDLA
jgi:hypothetical protein